MYTLHVPGERASTKAGPTDGKYQYQYPSIDGEELDLRPGSELHERIKNEVTERAQMSYDVMKNRHSDWNYTDKTLTAYLKASDYEELLKSEQSDFREHRKPVSVVVPYTYATLETLLTYLSMAFLEFPYFRYEPTTGEDVVAAMLLEGVVEAQCRYFKAGLSLHTMFRDGLAYGIGPTAIRWEKKYGRIRSKADQGRTALSDLLYEGNRIVNIDPYMYLPDATVPIHNQQDGEYVGWVDKTSYTALISLEANSNDFFNVRHLKDFDGRSSIFSQDPSKRYERWSGSPRDNVASNSLAKPVDVVYMYISLIPEEWKLGKGEYPEKWIFGLAADQYVVLAKRLDLDHDLYPTSVFAPDYDGYGVAPISRLEVTSGLQTVLDFMFNSHIENVRKAINDTLVVDPFIINMEDFKRPGPGKLLRVRRAAWGRADATSNGVKQLPITDITRQHMSDIPQIMDFMSRVSASVDSLQGVMRSSGERRSATESRDTRMSALSRLARIAKICSLMCMYDLGYMCASHTQQLMEKSMQVNIWGRRQADLLEEYGQAIGNQYLKAEPSQLKIPFDLVIHDGSVEMGERADEWLRMFQVMSANPAVGIGFDIVRVFKHIGRMLGAKNINEFVKKAGGANIQMAQTDQLMREAERGNVVPIKGAEGKTGGGNNLEPGGGNAEGV